MKHKALPHTPDQIQDEDFSAAVLSFQAAIEDHRQFVRNTIQTLSAQRLQPRNASQQSKVHSAQDDLLSEPSRSIAAMRSDALAAQEELQTNIKLFYQKLTTSETE